MIFSNFEQTRHGQVGVRLEQQERDGQVGTRVINIEDNGNDGDLSDLDDVCEHHRGKLFRGQVRLPNLRSTLA